MSASRGRPFAYSVTRVETLIAVRPTLVSAVSAARYYRFDEPVLTLAITAWFADGKTEAISHELLWTPDRCAWISPDEARQLEERLYPAAIEEQPC